MIRLMISMINYCFKFKNNFRYFFNGEIAYQGNSQRLCSDSLWSSKVRNVVRRDVCTREL